MTNPLSLAFEERFKLEQLQMLSFLCFQAICTLWYIQSLAKGSENEIMQMLIYLHNVNLLFLEEWLNTEIEIQWH